MENRIRRADLQNLVETARKQYANEMAEDFSQPHSDVTEIINNIVVCNLNRLFDSPEYSNRGFCKWLNDEFRISLSEQTFSTYMKGRSKVPYSILLAASVYLDQPIGVFFVDPANPPVPESTLKNFLDLSLGGNNKYAYDFEQHSIYLKPLTNRTYYCYWLPLSSPYNAQDIPHGKLRFFAGKDNVCHVMLEIRGHSAHDKATYDGFALILSPNTNNGTCWCFLKMSKNIDAELVVLSFRFRSNDVQSDYMLDSRLAEVLTITANKARPTISRMILTKNEVAPDKTMHITSLLHLGGDEIYISSEVFADIKNEVRDNLRLTEALEKLKLTSIGEVFIINSVQLEKLKVPHLLSLIKGKSISPPRNKLSEKADEALVSILEWIKK